ncbi:MAG: methionyl-tRNA formyltransferase [Synechococcales bacterium]|nr:methionyl-tRNA formyltransferase [Synechococcales bacterium]
MLNIIFFGTPQFAVPTLEALIAHPDFNVLAVVTQPDKRRNRGNELSPCPVKTLALHHHLTVWDPKSVKKDGETLAKLRSLAADFFVVVAYGQILSQEILDMPKYGCINGHGSLLPKYRGAAPIQWALVNGESVTGMTTMLMDAGMDTGAMLLTSQLPIQLLDDAHQVASQLAQQSAELILETLPKLAAGEIQPMPQNAEAATYAPLIQKADYELDWSLPAIALHNKIRGFYPNCGTPFRQGTLKILKTIPLHPQVATALPPEFTSLTEQLVQEAASGTPATPGTLIAVIKNQGAIVQTAEGGLLLQEVQLSGKRVQSGWDFANGCRIEVGERVGQSEDS